MKFGEWIKKFPDAHSALLDSVKEESITLDDIKGFSTPLYEGLRTVVAEEMEAQVQKTILEKYDEYLESIREELTEAELNEARAEGVALMFQELGLSGEQAESLVNNDKLLELLTCVVEEIQNPGAAEEALNGEGTGLTEEELQDQIASSPAMVQLQEQLEETTKKADEAVKALSTANVKKAIAECRAKFPYDVKVFDENIVPLMEDLESEAEVTEVYENQIGLLKATNAPTVKRGSARFLTNDSAEVEETQEQQRVVRRRDMDPDSLEASLLDEAAVSLETLPPPEVTGKSSPTRTTVAAK